MTQADRIRALHAAEPLLSVRELGRRLGVHPGSVQSALRSRPREPREAVSVTLPAELVAELRAEAERTGEPVSRVVERRLATQRRK